MKKLIVILLSLLFAQILFAQKKSPRKYIEIYQFKKSDGKYIGTMIGKQIKEGLYSDVLIIRKRKNTVDTLFILSKKDLFYAKGWGDGVGKSYDGYGIEIDKPGGFEWWMVKISGPASDGAAVVWNNKLKKFITLDSG